MSEKAIAGVFGALGVLVLAAGAFLFAGRAFLVEPPDATPKGEAPAVDEPPPEPVPRDVGTSGSGRKPARQGMDRVPNPDDDDVEYFDVTYEKLHWVLEKKDFTELRRLIDLAHGQVDPKIIGELVALLEEQKHAYVVAGILGTIRTAGLVDALHDLLLRTESPIARRAAVQAMAEGGKEEAVPALLSLMQGSTDRALVALTSTALGTIGSPEAVEGVLRTLARGAWPGLMGTLQNSLAQVRDERSIGLIVHALEESGDDKVRGALLVALGQGGSPSVVQPLLRFVKNEENVDMASRGVQALSRIGTPEAMASVLDLAQSEGPLRNAAQYGLRNAKDPSVLPRYLETLDSSRDEELRKSLLFAIGKLKDKSATPRLVDAMRSPGYSVDTRIAAAKGLAEMRDPASIPALTETVRSDSNVNLRISAVRALERIGDPKSIAVLTAVLEEEAPANFKAIVRYSINRIRMKRPSEPRRR